MDAKFLALTGLVSAAAFGAVWIATMPEASDAAAVAPDRDISIQARKPHARFTVEAPPEDMQPDSAVEVEGDTPAPIAQSSVYYPNCRAAWQAGAAPIRRGEPGYRAELDGDSDGIACEPIRSR